MTSANDLSVASVTYGNASPGDFGSAPPENGEAKADDAQNEEAVPIDTMFLSIGEFGAYQRRHYMLVASVWIACSWCTLSMVFVNAKPSWRYSDGSIGVGDMPCTVSNDGLVVELVESWHTVQGEWGLTCDTHWKSGLIDSLFFAAFGVGAVLMGGLADTYGRRRVFFFVVILASVSTLMSAASHSFEVYVFLRSFAGFAIGGMGVVAFVFAQEFIGPSWQGITGVTQALIFSIGNVILTPLAYSLPGWRSLTVATGIFPLFFLGLFCVVPESPRWLIAQGDLKSATSVVCIIAEGNGASMPVGKVLACASSASQASSAQLFQGVLLKRTLVMMVVWFVNSFVYYGLALQSGNLGGSVYFNFLLGSLTELPSMVLGAYLVDRWGRKKTLSYAMLLSGLACGACMILPAGAPTTTAAMIGKFGITPSFAIVFVYCAELFPTVVRSAAMGLSSSAARVGGVVAPVVVMLGSAWAVLPLMIFGAAAIVAGLLILTMPETLGKPMPETMEDCEKMDIYDKSGHIELQEDYDKC
eukprot:TRINITY_DN20841_c0_g1_i1.p1 TRINITY_DN20841_c0_g1~~TRINITY_DN20841_c0_g1_i1.p1  ORF type:complete len:546 (+),score=59.44 TRINITY_DN20841_c0_g1_i1:52-1638(+)